MPALHDCRASDVQNLLLRKEFAHATAQQVDYSTAIGFCYWVWWISFFFLGGGDSSYRRTVGNMYWYVLATACLNGKL